MLERVINAFWFYVARGCSEYISVAIFFFFWISRIELFSQSLIKTRLDHNFVEVINSELEIRWEALNA